MQLGAFATLNTMIWPQSLRPIAQVDRIEGLPACMGARKRMVATRMPVLGKNNMLKPGRNAVDHIDDRVTIRHSKRAAGTEIILYIDDDKYILRIDPHTLETVPQRKLLDAGLRQYRTVNPKGTAGGLILEVRDIEDFPGKFDLLLPEYAPTLS